MKIFKRIKDDHKKQRTLMETLVNTEGDSKERRKTFNILCEELRAHAAAEEQVFYASLMENETGTDKSRHSVAEHEEALGLLKELEDMSMSSSGWLQKFKKLKEDNEHHMEEEEKEVFDLARKALSSNTLEDMFAAFEDRKEAELAQA